MAQRLQGMDELFKGRHFEREVIVLCVRWYLRFKLSLRDLVEMMAERGLSLAHTTIMRWVRHYTPEFEKRRGCQGLLPQSDHESPTSASDNHAGRLRCVPPRGA